MPADLRVSVRISTSSQELRSKSDVNIVYRPLLDEYINTAGFPEREPLDYSIAHLVVRYINEQIIGISKLTQNKVGQDFTGACAYVRTQADDEGR